MATLESYEYHREDAGVIYCADCLEVLPLLPNNSVDLVLTDPPYMGLVGGKPHFTKGGVARTISERTTIGDEWFATIEWFAHAWRITTKGLYAFTAYKGLCDTITAIGNEHLLAVMVWYKRNAPPQPKYVPRHNTEFICLFRKATGLVWGNLKTTCFDILNLQSGCIGNPERATNDRTGAVLHPTQKPIQLIRQLLSIGGEIILDPFLGSGTTAVAAKQLGRKFIGIEISEEYCAIAKERLSQEVLAL